MGLNGDEELTKQIKGKRGGDTELTGEIEREKEKERRGLRILGIFGNEQGRIVEIFQVWG